MLRLTENAKKILVIGNGFDLAHGLPTRYIDFLYFIKFMCQYGDKNSTKLKQNYLLGSDFKKFSTYVTFLKASNAEKIFSDANQFGWSIKKETDNLWINYFYDKAEQENKNWVDFEAEISTIIQNLEEWLEYKKSYKNLPWDDQSIPALERKKIKELISKVYDPFFFPTGESRCYEEDKVPTISRINDFGKLLKTMEDDLDILIQHLEIYLLIVMQYIDKTKKLNFIDKIGFDYLLSFNYTSTYEKIYGNISTCNYIHGVIDENREKEDNNMVLGIEEYLQDEARNTNRTFVWFKKYFQRIYKRTGSVYKEWLDVVNKYKREVEIYIVGHSLAITDKDIFQELILNSKKTVIYYFNKETLKSQISNMIEIIGQDELVKKTSDGSLIFEEQPDKFTA